MNAFQKVLSGAGLAVMLAGGLAAPAMAQALDNKKSVPAATVSTTDIDFGDDSSQWSNDGECDDPRFEGAGAAVELLDEDMYKDATDCRTAYAAGAVTLIEGGAAPLATVNDIDFGDDSSPWSNDGECDDPRFQGAGSASELLDDDIRKDATDCRTAYDAGTVSYVGDDAAAVADIDFGDDSSEWSNDGECDDPRFQGAGSAAELLDADILKDATDCRAAYDAGTISYVGDSPAAIDYGDNTSQWSNDGECDDPRFFGSGVASELLDEDIGHDANDCRAAVEAGTARFSGDAVPVATFDYGGDWSKWANDGECDDLRFQGPGTDKKLLTNDMYGDAADCRMLEEQGMVSIRTVYSPEYAAGAPYDSSHIEFGDNKSSYADDDRCDDPRFEGPGAASVLLDSDEYHDSADCRAAYEAGRIVLIGES